MHAVASGAVQCSVVFEGGDGGDGCGDGVFVSAVLWFVWWALCLPLSTAPRWMRMDERRERREASIITIACVDAVGKVHSNSEGPYFLTAV